MHCSYSFLRTRLGNSVLSLYIYDSVYFIISLYVYLFTYLLYYLIPLHATVSFLYFLLPLFLFSISICDYDFLTIIALFILSFATNIFLFSVPGPPSAIRALPSGPQSVVVSWLPPERPNGVLTHYTLYYRPLNAHRVCTARGWGMRGRAEGKREKGGMRKKRKGRDEEHRNIGTYR